MIGRLTFADYEIIKNAIEERHQDEDRDLHYGAYLTSMAGERDKKGKPRFPTFEHFYKHKSAKNDIFENLKEHLRDQHE